MSGIHAKVLSRIGAITVNIPGGEIMTSLQAGVVDGVEWIFMVLLLIIK